MKKKDLEKEKGVRVGTEFWKEDIEEDGPSRKISRRIMEQGVEGEVQFND